MLLDVAITREVHLLDLSRAQAEITRHRNLKQERRQNSSSRLLDAYEVDQWEETYQFLLESQENLRAVAQSEVENFIARCINEANQLNLVAVWDYDYQYGWGEIVSFIHPRDLRFQELLGEPGAFAALKS